MNQQLQYGHYDEQYFITSLESNETTPIQDLNYPKISPVNITLISYLVISQMYRL